MAHLLLVCPLRPGTQEQWLYQELAGLRRGSFEAACRQAGISQVQVRLVQLRRSELLLISVHSQHLRQALLELASSQRPFEHWLRSQLLALLEWDVLEGLPEEPQELLFTWPGENLGS